MVKGETGHEEMCAGMRCMLPSCHPFSVIVSGPTGCGKTAWVQRHIDNIREKIEPIPSRIWYCYGEFQPTFNSYPWTHFHEGLPDLSDPVLDRDLRSFEIRFEFESAVPIRFDSIRQ